MANNYNSTLQSNNTDLQAILNTINELPNAGGSDPVLQDKTITPTTSKQTVTADSGYDGLDTVTVNAMPTATQATPSITVSSSGLITASATQSAGYVTAGTKSGTKQLTVQAAQTITPSTSNQTIASGRYLTGTQTIKGDANLKAANIAEGVSIFGVTGTHSGSENLDTELSTQESLISQLSYILDSKASGGSGGGSVETCTVTITKDIKFTIAAVHYTAFIDNQITSLYRMDEDYPSSGFVLNNVVCNSAISVNATNISGMAGFVIDGTAEFQAKQNYTYAYYFKAPSVSGENCSIYMYDDD